MYPFNHLQPRVLIIKELPVNLDIRKTNKKMN